MIVLLKADKLLQENRIKIHKDIDGKYETTASFHMYDTIYMESQNGIKRQAYHFMYAIRKISFKYKRNFTISMYDLNDKSM